MSTAISVLSTAVCHGQTYLRLYSAELPWPSLEAVDPNSMTYVRTKNGASESPRTLTDNVH